MAQQFYTKVKPINNLVSGYNNDGSTATLIVGAGNKVNTPFVSVLGSKNFVTGGANLSSLHIVGHNNTAHNVTGLIQGDNNVVLPNSYAVILGDNNIVDSSAGNVFIFGNSVIATASNSFIINADLTVTGTINGNQNIIGATGATGPAGTASNYTPQSLQDPFGNVGTITFDNSFLYIKTNQGWCSTVLTPLQKQSS